jgi:hypothetical protein
MTAWIGLASLLLAAPGTSPPPTPACHWVAEGDSMRVTTRTLVYVHPHCPDAPATREGLIETLACENQAKALRLQARRLVPRLAQEGVAVVHCPAGVRVGLESEDGSSKSVPLRFRASSGP